MDAWVLQRMVVKREDILRPKELAAALLDILQASSEQWSGPEAGVAASFLQRLYDLLQKELQRLQEEARMNEARRLVEDLPDGLVLEEEQLAEPMSDRDLEKVLALAAAEAE